MATFIQENSIFKDFLPNSQKATCKNSESISKLYHLILSSNPLECAQFIAFTYGKNWSIITNLNEYQERYKNLYEGKNSNLPLYAYDHYDTSQIEPPHFKDGNLNFYIEENNLPYKISCKWLDFKNLKLNQELLNIVR